MPSSAYVARILYGPARQIDRRHDPIGIEELNGLRRARFAADHLQADLGLVGELRTFQVQGDRQAAVASS